MKKKVNELYRQSSNWEIKGKHTFYNRNYEVDDSGNFYRNGIKIIVQPDKKLNISHSLTDDEQIKTRFKLHQIMMQTFSEDKIKGKTSVDHIDRDRLNNKLSNLRFATRKEQFMNRENVEYKNKKILCLNNGFVYESCKQAEKELNLIKNTVSRVARGERKSAHGYKFEFL